MSSILILSGALIAIFGFGGWVFACMGRGYTRRSLWEQTRVASSAAALGIALMLTGGIALGGGNELSARLGQYHPLYEQAIAAEEGDPEAQFLLGNQYYYGNDPFRQDFVQAAKWHRLAARQGYVPAMHRLAGLYREGRGVKKDDVLARIWSRKAAFGDQTG